MAAFRGAGTGILGSDPMFVAGMRAATAHIAQVIKAVASAMPSKKIPPTVVSYVRRGIGYVSAGGPGGRVAPNAYMFETPGARHPYFAPVGSYRYLHEPWYTQPYRPFMETGAEIAHDDAAEILAEVWGYAFAESLGFDVPGISFQMIRR
jgi:hypothetical protein